MIALDERFNVELHVVTKIIEAEFVVRSICDVARIGFLSLHVVHIVLDTADAEAKELMDLSHPLRVAQGKIIIDRYDVDAAPSKAVKIRRQGGNESLTFTGSHLRDPALM